MGPKTPKKDQDWSANFMMIIGLALIVVGLEHAFFVLANSAIWAEGLLFGVLPGFFVAYLGFGVLRLRFKRRRK